MFAIQVQDDDRHSLAWCEVPDPEPGAQEVLIRVEAAGINRADLLQRKGQYPPPPGASDILGLEAVGEVVATGADVSRWQVGDQVAALLPGGGYAELVSVHQDVALPIPTGLSPTEAAALPEVFFTAYLNLFIEGQLQPGESALIHAGGSGVGTAAIQLCRAFDSPVFATASASKLERLRELGADLTIDRHTEAFAQRVAEHTSGQGVNVILCPVGAAYLESNLASLSSGGRLVIIGLMGGAVGDIKLGPLLVRRLRIIGSVLRSRSVSEKAQIAQQLEQRVWPRIAAGEIRPIVQEVFPMREAETAHELLSSNETFGKVILVRG